MVIKKWQAKNTLAWKYAVYTVRLIKQPSKTKENKHHYHILWIYHLKVRKEN